MRGLGAKQGNVRAQALVGDLIESHRIYGAAVPVSTGGQKPTVM
jgi:hypothetical protein